MLARNVTKNMIAFVAHDAIVEVHRHHCFQIVVSITAPFSGTLGGESFTNKTGFIINQNIPHSCMAHDASVLVYFVDAESYSGWQLKAMLAGKKFIDTDLFFSAEQRDYYFAAHNWDLPTQALRQMADEIFDILLPVPEMPEQRVVDERIVTAIEFIETHLSENLQIKTLAALIKLSSERTRHLFVQEAGIPFSQFVLWKRLKQVIVLVIRDQLTLVDAAFASGFADQAHLSRTFKRMFGISAKAHLKHSRYVQFLNPLVD